MKTIDAYNKNLMLERKGIKIQKVIKKLNSKITKN